MSSVKEVVVLDYNDLVAGVDLSSKISEAFGFDGLGLLTVKNVPNFVEYRTKLLPLSRKFANLPDEVKAKYVHEDSQYSFGWSHGKEKLQGKPDVAKGSFYANPQFDRPVDDEDIILKFAPFVHPNIWPTPDMPEMEPAFKQLGQLIVAVGTLVAKQCDNYVNSVCPTYAATKLTSIIESSKCCKARLLHYFPMEPSVTSTASSDESFSSWCGWHNDHGSLTGLVSAMYIDTDGNILENPDPASGLYIRSRSSELVKASIPATHIAFQIGETAQVHSGGILQATPHAVRGANSNNVSREGFAVFMEPMWTEPMSYPTGRSLEEVQSQSASANLPPGVPQLKARWNPQQDFGAFTTATLNSYY